jgi:hypothetical protein
MLNTGKNLSYSPGKVNMIGAQRFSGTMVFRRNLGAFPARSAGNRAIRLYLFCLRQKRIPLLSLARANSYGVRLGSFASQNSWKLFSALRF